MYGLDDYENYCLIVYDMVLFMCYVMNNKIFKEILGIKVYWMKYFEEKWDWVWKNKNKLLIILYVYCIGGKIGYIKLVKWMFVIIVIKDGMDLIVVMINVSDDWNDYIFMYENVFDKYDMISLVLKGELVDIKNFFYKD